MKTVGTSKVIVRFVFSQSDIDFLKQTFPGTNTRIPFALEVDIVDLAGVYGYKSEDDFYISSDNLPDQAMLMSDISAYDTVNQMSALIARPDLLKANKVYELVLSPNTQSLGIGDVFMNMQLVVNYKWLAAIKNGTSEACDILTFMTKVKDASGPEEVKSWFTENYGSEIPNAAIDPWYYFLASKIDVYSSVMVGPGYNNLVCSDDNQNPKHNESGGLYCNNAILDIPAGSIFSIALGENGTYYKAVLDRYNAIHNDGTYGYLKLGIPFDNGGGVYVHDWYGVLLQDFQHQNCPNGDCSNAPADSNHIGTDGRTAIVYNQKQDKAWLLHDGFWAYYKSLDKTNMPRGPFQLGAPRGEEFVIGNLTRQDFDYGYLIFESGVGVSAYDSDDNLMGRLSVNGNINEIPINNTFIKFDQNDSIFFVFNNRLWDITDEAVFYAMGGDFSQLTIYEFNRFPEITSQFPVMGTIASEGLIAKVPTGSNPNNIYKLENNQWRWFRDDNALKYYGYTVNNIVNITQEVFDMFPQSPSDLVALDKMFDPKTAPIFKWYNYDVLTVLDPWRRYNNISNTKQFIEYLQQYTCEPLTVDTFRNFQRANGTNVSNTGASTKDYQDVIRRGYLEDIGILSDTVTFWTSVGNFYDRQTLRDYIRQTTSLLPLMPERDRAYYEEELWDAKKSLARPKASKPKCN